MTNHDRNGHNLSLKQENAIDILVLGKSDREVAESIGVARQTVTQWRNHDDEFVVALNRRRADIWGSQTDRLRTLVVRAVDVLEANLDSEDERLRQVAAVHILRSVGLYGRDLEPDGPADAEKIKRDRRHQESTNELLDSIGIN